jgi:putative ABC transport system ATP-binding protein
MQTNSGHARPVIATRNLSKIYRMSQHNHVSALQNVSLEIQAGEFVAVTGTSGSGKTTFMNLIGCLDTPTSGEYRLDGRLVSKLSSDELAIIRNRMIGFVFQNFNLLGRATALQNVALPMIYTGIPKSEREKRAHQLLQLLGLKNHARHKPTELSGGQQQRVAIARALVNDPALLLADEPTGNLDSQNGLELMAVLQALNERGSTILLVTHDPNIASFAQRQLLFLDGRLLSDTPVSETRSAYAEWMKLKQDATSVTESEEPVMPREHENVPQ